MSDTGSIEAAFERLAAAMSRRPSLGHSTGVSKTRVHAGGLRCEISEGPWRLSADTPEQAGGNGSAPTPGVLGRVESEVCPLFFRLGTGDVLQREFEGAGFGQVSSERLETRLVYSSPEQACGAAFEGGPVALRSWNAGLDRRSDRC